MESILRLQHISKDYQTGGEAVHALCDVTISFRRSEFAAILGPSGCGKTTLLNVIGGLDRYGAGDLIVDGVSTRDFTGRDWDAYRNGKIGFVFQSYNLMPNMSVLENVAIALSIAGVRRAERRKRAEVALQRVGLADQMKKRPAQLSGGQMQRVAIARAIVNDPEILLCDEPTGALDSETSIQVMEILKEISSERLVIMVTHNEALVSRYATRMIRLLDGRAVSDTDPVLDGSQTAEERPADFSESLFAPTDFPETPSESSETASEPSEIPTEKPKRVRMSLFTAFMIALKSLFSKKMRMFWTSISGAIGIFGVTLVLAISAGMNSYVNYLQTEAVGDSAITIAETAYNLEDAGKLLETTAGGKPYPKDAEGVYPYLSQSSILNELLVSNNITDEYIDYIKNMDPAWRNALNFAYSANINVVHVAANGNYARLSSWASYSKQIIDNNELVTDNYDVLFKLGDGGTEADGYTGNGYPAEMHEVSIVVDRYNRLSANALVALGLMVKRNDELPEVIPYSEIVGKEYDLILNDGWYSKTKNGNYAAIGTSKYQEAAEGEHCLKVRIVSVLRPKNDKANQWLTAGLAYLPELSEFLIKNSAASEVATAQREDPAVNVLTGVEFTDTEYGTVSKQQAYEKVMKTLGGTTTPTRISIYPKNSVMKLKILDYLNEWNTTLHPESPVVYTDYTVVALSALNALVNIVTYILIAFSAIALIVSTVMIAVVMNMSVLERTREIGVLRSIGARKTDIANLFNCETLLIGVAAGILGILLAIGAGAVTNAVLGAMFGVSSIVRFSWPIVLGMMGLSVGLTLLAGLIPAILAARRDPVKCLKAE